MEVSFAKLWACAGGGLLGALIGAAIAGWRASAVLAGNSTGAPGDEMDAAIRQTAPHAFGSTAVAVFQGAFIGGIIGLLLMIGLFIVLNTERARDDRELQDPDG